MGDEKGNKHCNNAYFYTNARQPVNKLREIKCLVLHKDNDMLDTYRTSLYQNIKYTEKIKVTCASAGVVKSIRGSYNRIKLAKQGTSR